MTGDLRVREQLEALIAVSAASFQHVLAHDSDLWR
jgi:hypothetical protein